VAVAGKDTSLQQNGAQLIDQSPPLSDQTVPRPMKGLHIELVRALQFDKAHRWSRRAALPHIAERDTPLGRWAKELMRRTHRNVAVVALANKLARIAWAVLAARETV
jgi:hypothetical protein